MAGVTGSIPVVPTINSLLLRISGITLAPMKHAHMRELRVQSGGRPLRIFYAFDRRSY